ncbi:2-dehydropantoate 2-reductase [Tuberibacillus calidus]|uniref:2-dehydropantoate 2-reductase n=1 Tax=Tuberibacillus calidus TaxID=340097 RepID=UPI0004833F51|nr:2-dehydropantoate 2-reductase [Tuberibacillus calidus]
MRIGIVGGGAIGLLVYGYLSQIFPTTIYVRRPEQRDKLLKEGLTVANGPGFIRDVHVALSESAWDEDLIILAVKQPDLPTLLAAHPKAAVSDQTLLFLQNGAGHLDLLEDLHYEHLFIGLVEHGAEKTSDTTVIHKGVGTIKIALIKGDRQRVAPLLANEAFPMTFVSDWRKALDEKLLVNAIINPLTALYGIRNGELLSNVHFKRAMRTVFDEIMPFLTLPNPSKAWEHVVGVCQKTSENHSSMLQDLEAGRMTEVGAILGPILKRAEARSVHLPVVRFLYESIKAKEHMRSAQC